MEVHVIRSSASKANENNLFLLEMISQVNISFMLQKVTFPPFPNKVFDSNRHIHVMILIFISFQHMKSFQNYTKYKRIK